MGGEGEGGVGVGGHVEDVGSGVALDEVLVDEVGFLGAAELEEAVSVLINR